MCNKLKSYFYSLVTYGKIISPFLPPVPYFSNRTCDNSCDVLLAAASVLPGQVFPPQHILRSIEYGFGISFTSSSSSFIHCFWVGPLHSHSLQTTVAHQSLKKIVF